MYQEALGLGLRNRLLRITSRIIGTQSSETQCSDCDVYSEMAIRLALVGCAF